MGSDLPGAALHIGLLVRSAAKTMTMAGFKIPTSRQNTDLAPKRCERVRNVMSRPARRREPPDYSLSARLGQDEFIEVDPAMVDRLNGDLRPSRPLPIG
jgi:hypothetical protein